MSNEHSAPEGDDPQGGFALAAVLWFMLFVTAFITPFVVTAQTTRWVATNVENKARLDLLADGLLTLLSMRLSNPQDLAALQGSVPTDSSLISCSSGLYQATIRLQDQRGLVDLNAGGEDLLAAGLRALDVEDAEVTGLVRAITSFRSYEPEQPDQKSKVLITGGRKAAPFESVVELTDIEPLRDVEPARLHQVFTTYSRSAAVLLASAPPALARFLAQARDGSVIRSKAEPAPSPFAVEVTIRFGAKGIRGYSGYIVVPLGSSDSRFRRIEPLIESDSEESGERMEAEGPPCPASLQDDVTAALAEPDA